MSTPITRLFTLNILLVIAIYQSTRTLYYTFTIIDYYSWLYTHMSTTKMLISRRDYDQQPLAVQQGALLLWGNFLGSHWAGNQFCQLYEFNNFLVQICYDASLKQIISLRSFSARKMGSFLNSGSQQSPSIQIRV